MDRTTLNSKSTLERISSLDFQAGLSVTDNPKAIRTLIGSTDECRALRRLYVSGLISDNDLTEYVRQLFASFRVGERFPFEISVICVAVAIESVAAEFAQDLLLELSNLHRRELPLLTRVAKVCLVEWLGSKGALK